MNTFYKLFVVKGTEDTCILLYGYGLPDNNETRDWNSGLIDKKLKLYRLTCVMDKDNSSKFQCELMNTGDIKLTDEFKIKGNYVKRPDILTYSRDKFNNKVSILKSISKVTEYWNINKELLFRELQNVYINKEVKKQREKIHDVIYNVSKEISINLLNEASERVGNIEVYLPNSFKGKFEYETKRIENKKMNDISVKGIRVKKINNNESDLLVNCVLNNGNRCVLNQIKEMKIKDSYIDFDANEEISEVNIDIWNKESTELVYSCHENLMRQVIGSININNNSSYILHDEWTNKLEKTFGGSEAKIKKLDQIRKIEFNNSEMVSKVGNYKNDPWNESGRISRRLVRKYRYENVKGAFCKKVGEGECEIDSFCKVAEYLNKPYVDRAIIVDPYFSIKAMEKFLGRITNGKLKLEVVTSLNDIDPDKDVNESKNTNYLNEVKDFLKKNADIIHKHLRIFNITQNGKTAIHDRYLLRLLSDGSMDGYLLSNSLNSAGQNYSFVIAPMDKEVVYSVLEYVNEIKDNEIQKKKNKKERLAIETLWDTYDEKYKKEMSEIIDSKPWELYMRDNYSSGQSLKLKDVFLNGWNSTKEKAKENILKLCWYLYHSNDKKIRKDLNEFINKIDKNKIFDICNDIALELEEEEKQYEENDLNSKMSEVYTYRNALDIDKQDSVKINSQYLMRYPIYEIYKVNNYLSCLYEIIYDIEPIKLVDIMENAHSPKALQVLLLKMICDRDINLEIYNRLLSSEFEWLNKLAYYYLDEVVIKKVKNKEYPDHKIFNNIEKETLIYQYASCIEEISFRRNQISKNDSCLEILEIYDDEFEFYVKEDAKLINEGISIDENKLFKLLNGPNEKINCENYYYLIQNLNNDIDKNIFLIRIIDLLKQKWSGDEHFISGCDYRVTYYAAYSCLIYWNNSVDIMFKELKINNNNLKIATEPGKYDMDFDSWNKSVQKVLWQLLFLKNYKELLDENGIVRDEDYNKISDEITELSAIKNQTDKWYDINGLIESVFDN